MTSLKARNQVLKSPHLLLASSERAKFLERTSDDERAWFHLGRRARRREASESLVSERVLERELGERIYSPTSKASNPVPSSSEVKVTFSELKYKATLPIGPLRCFAMIISA